MSFSGGDASRRDAALLHEATDVQPGRNISRSQPGVGQEKSAGKVSAKAGRSADSLETEKVVLVSGWRAGLAVLEHRPQDVLRFFFTGSQRKLLQAQIKQAAERRLAFHQVEPQELERICSSVHHQGLVVAVRPLCWGRLEQPPVTARAAGVRWLALDGISNPHNLGALLRVGAFFGVSGMLCGEKPGVPLSSAALRTAQGAAESLQLFGTTTTLARLLARFAAAGWQVLGLESEVPQALTRSYQQQAGDTPLVLVLGGEERGISPAVRKACTQLRCLQPSGALSSLNVSTAAAAALALLQT